MNIESLKGNWGWVTSAILTCLLIVLAWQHFNPDPRLKVPQISDKYPLHQLTAMFDGNNLRVFDAKGNVVEPVRYNPRNALGDFVEHTKRSKLTITASEDCNIVRADKNPSCNPILLFGNACYAPHSWCCG